MASPAALQSAPPAWGWCFQWVGRRAGILAFSLTLGVLAYTPAVFAQDEAVISRRSFTSGALCRAGPAVVRIDAVPLGRHPSPPSNRLDSDPLFFDPFFEQFFNQQRHQKVLGAGVIFTEAGFILTTAQTVEKMDYYLGIYLADGRILFGRLVGVDFVSNLAVVKVAAPPPFPTAPLGDSDTLEVGDWTAAIGRHPSAPGNTVTTGTVSSLNHHRSNHQGATGKQLALIRTDAAMDRDNAGGALVNVAGQVIGINTLARSGGPTDHHGFAIPINTARPIAEELIRTGLSRPTVGISSWSLTPVLAREFNQSPDNTGLQLPERHGVLIVHVRPRSPAEKAGLRAGDVVLTAGGSKVASPDELFQAVESAGAGGQLQLGLWRQNRHLTVVPEEMAEQMRRAMRDTVTPLPSPVLP